MVTNRIISIIICFFSICTYSQERVNGTVEKFDKKSPTINHATLWRYEDPKWKRYSNLSQEDGAYILHNFIYIRVNKLNIKDNQYFVLMVKSWDGEYEYPSIDRGWYNFTRMEFFTYTVLDFQNMKDIAVGKTVILEDITSSLWRANWGESYSEHRTISKLKEGIIRHETKKTASIQGEKLILRRAINKGVDVIRFLPPDNYNYIDIEEHFEHNYYEIPYSIFKRLFIN